MNILRILTLISILIDVLVCFVQEPRATFELYKLLARRNIDLIVLQFFSVCLDAIFQRFLNLQSYLKSSLEKFLLWDPVDFIVRVVFCVYNYPYIHNYLRLLKWFYHNCFWYPLCWVSWYLTQLIVDCLEFSQISISDLVLFVQSWLLSLFIRPRSNHMTTVFRNFKFEDVGFDRPPGHPHPLAASIRAYSNIGIDKFIRAVHMVPYSVSMSRGENSKKIDGTRSYYFDRDLTMKPKRTIVNKRHILKLVDVDYYAPMNQLASYFQPMIIYTFSPRAPAGRMFEGSYCTFSDGTCGSTRAFASRYRHRLLAHDHDFVKFSYGYFDYYFFVEQRRIADSEYCLYFYSPAYRLLRLFEKFWCGNTPILEYRNCVQGNYAVTRWVDKDDNHIAIAQLESDYSVIVSESALRSARLRYKAYPKSFGYVTLELAMRCSSFNKILDPPILKDYIEASEDLPLLSTSTLATITYRCTTSCNELADDCKDTAVSVHNPIVDGGCAPANERASEVVAVQERVLNLRECQPTSLTDAQIGYANEFIDMLLGDEQLLPFEHDEVLEIQSRPTQVASYERMLSYQDLNPITVSTFFKRETYVDLKPPRIITDCDPVHRVELSRYTLSLAAHCKKFRWYAFGSPPNRIAENVSCLVRAHPYCIATDYSRFDGQHGKQFHEFEKLIMLRAFGVEAEDLVSMEINLNTSTRRGYKYNTGYSRLSGSPMTSIMNTLDNAFVCYVAFRQCLYTPDLAFKSLGIYGGDDGLTYIPDPSVLVDVATSFHASLKAVKIRRGKPVDFLGRVYVKPDVCTASIYDLRRFLTKANLVIIRGDVSPQVQVARKAFGYSVTDAKTPIIKEWIEFISLNFGLAEIPDSGQYFAMLSYDDLESRYPQLECDDPLVISCVAKLVPDFENILERINSGLNDLAPEPEFNDVLFDCVARGRIAGTSRKYDNSRKSSPTIKQTNLVKTYPLVQVATDVKKSRAPQTANTGVNAYSAARSKTKAQSRRRPA